jgi:hypothetical protein
MTFLESLVVALFCISMVFILLACVFALIKLSSFIIRLFADRKNSNAARSSDEPGKRDASPEYEEVFSSGTLKLQNVDEATAAMIIAIVSDESGIPLTELCFKSIRLIEPGKNKTI